MVSDPKMYNPKIVANLSYYSDSNPLTVASTQDKKDTPSSWISWPLGLLLQGVFDDHSTARLRFRNWDTKVTLKPTGSNHYNSTRQRSKSPYRDIDSTGSSRSESPEKY
ncbi:uncharacterized protein LOC132087776 [Daphnia carinata]|uniref:uncharacterized protein LOC132087776 n=1 Tax=Daphnia carinata TaxID=120202 RepID=UPI0028695F5A|nr:uncharacterized protein LOC132087776 [Daphnia carinata]